MQRKITIVLSILMVIYGLVTTLFGYVFVSLVLLFFCHKKWKLRALLTILAAVLIAIASTLLYMRAGDNTLYTMVPFGIGILFFIVGQYPWKTPTEPALKN